MGGADGVDVVLLEEADVLDHAGEGDGLAVVGVVLVAVHALDEDRDAVEEELAALDLDLAEAEGAALDFDDVALASEKGYLDAVEGRGAPNE